jgi:predicted O-methyltransferase YrrM
MKKTEVLEKLGLEDPFAGFEADPTSELWGWNGNGPVFGEVFNRSKPSLIIEVGSWMGQSTCTMANLLKPNDGCIIAIDTWLGSAEHWLDKDLKQKMVLVNGRPTFYNNFLSNCEIADVSGNVVPLSVPSQVGAEILKAKNITSKMIYIDGSHSFGDVFADILAYWDLLEAGGILFGDDWPWDSVSNAVKAAAAELGMPPVVSGINWAFQK